VNPPNSYYQSEPTLKKTKETTEGKIKKGKQKQGRKRKKREKEKKKKGVGKTNMVHSFHARPEPTDLETKFLITKISKLQTRIRRYGKETRLKILTAASIPGERSDYERNC